MECSICHVNLDGEQFPAKCIKCGAILCDDCSINNNFMCNSCNGNSNKEIKLDFVRRSYIELYKICPYAFKLLAIDGIEVKNNIYADIGIKLHELFEQSSLGNLTKSEMIKQYNEWFGQLNLEDFEGYQRKLTTEQFREYQYKHGLWNIDNYYEFESKLPNPYQTETTLFTNIGDDLPKVRITFDRINKNENGTYDILDYKTGKVYVGKKLATDLQVPLYIHSVKQNLGIDVNKFELLFTGEGKTRTFNKVSDDEYVCKVLKKEYSVKLSDTIEEIKSIFTQIKNGKLDIPHDINPWYCENMCVCRKAGHCAGNFNQQWRE